MQTIKKYLNAVQIISIILATIIVVLVPILQDTKYVSLGWFFIGLSVLGDGIFLKKWSKGGITWFRRNDKNYKKNLTVKYEDGIFYVAMIFGLILCVISFFDKLFATNYIAMLIAYLFAILVIIILAVMTDITNKKIQELIPKKK